MYEQAITYLMMAYFVGGGFFGSVTTAFCKNKIARGGAWLIGGVSGIIAGLVFVLNITQLKLIMFQHDNLGIREQITIGELAPSWVAAAAVGAFCVYVISLLSGGKNS